MQEGEGNIHFQHLKLFIIYIIVLPFWNHKNVTNRAQPMWCFMRQHLTRHNTLARNTPRDDPVQVCSISSPTGSVRATWLAHYWATAGYSLFHRICSFIFPFPPPTHNLLYYCHTHFPSLHCHTCTSFLLSSPLSLIAIQVALHTGIPNYGNSEFQPLCIMDT